MFQRTATRLKRKLWWQNIKLWIILIVIILVVLAVIISKCSHCDITVTSWSYVAGSTLWHHWGEPERTPHTSGTALQRYMCLLVWLWLFTVHVNFIKYYKCPRELSRWRLQPECSISEDDWSWNLHGNLHVLVVCTATDLRQAGCSQ